jgi:hypothetical protein
MGAVSREPGWVAKTSSGGGMGGVLWWWWSAYGEPLVAQSPELGLIPTRQPSMGGVLAPSVASANCAHLRVWEVGWGNVPLTLSGVLVRESRAAWLDEAL